MAVLVKDKVIDEKYVKRLLLKAGGMSRQPEPREAQVKKPFKTKLGAPFLHQDDGAVRLQMIIGLHPKGFREPSRKAKNWRSTSLMERLTGVTPTFVAHPRGDREALADTHHRELVKATQDVRNVPRTYLTRAQKALKASLPPLPKDQTLGAIKERHAKQWAARFGEPDATKAAA